MAAVSHDNAWTPDPQVERAHRALMTRSLVFLFAAGATLLLASLATPAGADHSRILTAAGASYGIAVLVALGRRSLPAWSFQLFLACATVMIEWVVYGSGGKAATYTVFYFWIATYAFQFFRTWQAGAQLVFIFSSYAVVLGLVSDPTSPSAIRWAVTTAALVVSGAMVGALKHRNSHLMEDLSNSARTDALSGLLNRRGFEERCAAELARAARSGARLSLLICDLDGFKAINDEFGHQEGDRALRLVGRVLAEEMRGGDSAARIGGEEFAVLLVETDEQEGYLVAGRLREAVTTACAHMRGAPTMSVGVATFPQHGGQSDSLLRAADQALYMAKQLGRDRAVLFNPSLVPTVSAAIRERNTHHERYLQTALRLAEVLDVRDAGTSAHSQTVGRYAEAIASELGLPEERVIRVRWAGVVHDIGKIGVPDSVLCKPGALTADEELEMQKHPEVGARILAGADLGDIAAWVVAHHERPDGSGYPYRLPDRDIPLEAKIIAVADAYEAMTNERVYRPAMSPAAAQQELVQGIGSQFDSRPVHALLRVLRGETSESRETVAHAAA